MSNKWREWIPPVGNGLCPVPVFWNATEDVPYRLRYFRNATEGVPYRLRPKLALRRYPVAEVCSVAEVCDLGSSNPASERSATVQPATAQPASERPATVVCNCRRERVDSLLNHRGAVNRASLRRALGRGGATQLFFAANGWSPWHCGWPLVQTRPG